MRILLLEDYPALAKVIEIGVGRLGFESTRVDRVKSALAVQGEFDLAILDIDLPDGSGVDVARQLLDQGRVREVVFFSGNPDAPAAREARSLGPFVDKSHGVEALLNVLRELHPQEVGMAKAVGAGDVPVRATGISGTRRRVR